MRAGSAQQRTDTHPLVQMEHMARLTGALLSWQDPTSRRRFTVGLVRNGDRPEFRYQDGTELEEAKRCDFAGYPAFPHLDAVYRSGVMESFASRLPKPTRADYDEYLRYWFIDPSTRPTALEVLAYTGGTLPRDGFGFLPVFPDTGSFDFVMELASTRHHDRSAAVGDEVLLVPEPNNPKDANAVAATIVHGDGPRCVGYAPRGLQVQILRWLRVGGVRAEVVRLNGSRDRPLVYAHVSVAIPAPR